MSTATRPNPGPAGGSGSGGRSGDVGLGGVDGSTGRAAPSRGLGAELSRDDVRRTLLVGAGTVLCFAPMRTIFSDWTWLVQTIGAVVCVLGPATFLRSRRAPRVVQLLPGLVLLVFYITAVYLHAGAIGGVIPGRHTWSVLAEMRSQAAEEIRTNSSPLDSTPALRLGVVPALALVAAIVDAYAVVRRAPALAGIPLLALFTICGATAGNSVGWFDFALAAAGFLVILSADSRVSLLGWGRVVPRRHGDSVSRPRLGLSGRRVGVAAVVLAVIVPAVLPGLSGNRLAEAFHSGQTTGAGLSPFAALKGQLNQGKVIDLATVTIEGNPSATPFYLRSKVLSRFTDTGWQSDAGPASVPLGQAYLGPQLDEGGDIALFTANITITGLKDDAEPLFSRPTALDGVPSGFRWDGEDSTVNGSTTSRGDSYTETVAQPDPSPEQLRKATTAGQRGGQIDPNLLAVPNNLPDLVSTTMQPVIAGQTTPYDQARALNDFFRDGENGFSYSLSTKAGDSGNDLVDFLTNRTGYCQQYAAALGIMLRIAGIPARVVLGYTHGNPDKNGRFTITSHDAHAWVEGYFVGLGWIAFDPTPLSSSRATGLSYDPRPSNSASSSTVAPGSRSRTADSTSTAGSAASSSVAAGGANGKDPGLHVPRWVLGMVVVLVSILALLSIVPTWRIARRRARWRDALRTRRLEPLWLELRDTSVDAGLDWGAATTPRQVPAWLAGLGVTGAQSVHDLAGRVERERYSRPGAASGSTESGSAASGSAASGSAATTTQDVHDGIDRVAVIGRSLRGRLSTRARILAWLWPRSVTTRHRRVSKGH